MLFDDKVKFTEKVKKLSQAALTQFVSMVQSLCPKAMRDVSAKKLQVRVDDLDKTSFLKISEFLDSQTSAEEDPLEPPNKIPKFE